MFASTKLHLEQSNGGGINLSGRFLLFIFFRVWEWLGGREVSFIKFQKEIIHASFVIITMSAKERYAIKKGIPVFLIKLLSLCRTGEGSYVYSHAMFHL